MARAIRKEGKEGAIAPIRHDVEKMKKSKEERAPSSYHLGDGPGHDLANHEGKHVESNGQASQRKGYAEVIAEDGDQVECA